MRVEHVVCGVNLPGFRSLLCLLGLSLGKLFITIMPAGSCLSYFDILIIMNLLALILIFRSTSLKYFNLDY